MDIIKATGQTYKNFTITKYLPLPELQSTFIEAVHNPTGAKILHVANDDIENLFCLSFQTLPSSSNGVAHILEHIVLCGSEKFPIKDPFFSMTRRSLNTYMNALTGQDFTCYPASSQIEKDFYNLLEVYLDAVFKPELKKMSFLQEGHRLEFAEPTDPKTPLVFQGVVYNEMKGAMSSPDSRLWEELTKQLTPDLPYAYNSGGNPKEIPSLTYEELKKFHQTFYHPSHCTFFFYGNLPLSKHLDYIEKHTLQNFTKVTPLPPLPQQSRFKEPRYIEAFYPITETEKLDKKTWICFSFLTAPLIHQDEILALNLLDSLLTDTDASILKKALLKSGLCTQADSSLDTEMSEAPWTFICKGCEKKDADKIQKILFETIQNCNFSQDQIEACLHQLEFDRTEIGAEGIPFGLTLFFRAGLIKQHGSRPENALLIHSLFNQLRDHLKDSSYLKNLIKKYILDNPHFVRVTFSPNNKLEEEEKKEEEKHLALLRPHIDEKKLLQQAKELAIYQEAIEHQSLNCLPKLTINDIPKKTRDFPLQKTQHEGLNVYHHCTFTNQIVYADLVFDLPHIEEKDLSLLSIFSKIVTELGTKNRNYEENLKLQQAYTGEFSAYLSLHTSSKDPNVCHPTLSFKGKSLARYADKLFFLFKEILQGADFSDTARVKELLHQISTSLQNKLNKNAMAYATQTALKAFTIPSFIQEHFNGITFFKAVESWVKNPEMFISDLIRLQKAILNSSTPSLVLCCEDPVFKQIQANHFYNLEQSLTTHTSPPWIGSYSLPLEKSQASFIAAPVAFTVEGLKTVSFGDKNAAYLLLSTELFSNCYLHKHIREKGGAYGSGASYSPLNGTFYLYSYRDPNLSKTLNHFQKALELIGNGSFTDEELQEAKLGIIQSLDAPVPPGQRAITAFSWLKANRSLQDRQKFRDSILLATKEDIAHAVKTLVLNQNSTIVSFLGESLYKKEEDKLKRALLIEQITS